MAAVSVESVMMTVGLKSVAQRTGDSTSAGDSSEYAYSVDDNMSSEMTQQHVEHVDHDYIDSPYVDSPAPDFDRSDMPNTREPSPEPLFNADYYKRTHEYFAEESLRAAGRDIPGKSPFTRRGSNEVARKNCMPARQSARPESSREPAMHGGNDAFPAQLYQTVAMMVPVMMVRDDGPGFMRLPVQPMPIPTQTPPGMTSFSQAGTQVPAVPSAMPTTPAPEQQALDAAAYPTSICAARSEEHVTGDRSVDKMPADQRAALCKRIYDYMIQKGMTEASGYLIADVFHEVRALVDSGPEGRRTAENSFCHLLRSAPEYFRIFRMKLQVAPRYGSFTRKGERMVSLVLEKEI